MTNADKNQRLQIATQLLAGIMSNPTYDPPRRTKMLHMVAEALNFADALISFVEEERNLDEFN